MKFLGHIILATGFLMLTACAAKNSSMSHSNHPVKEKKVAKKNLKKADDQLTASTSQSCQMAQDHRKILINKRSDGGCNVTYEKADSTKTIADARSLSFCSEVGTKVVKNLEQAGFKCESQVAEAQDHKTAK